MLFKIILFFALLQFGHALLCDFEEHPKSGCPEKSGRQCNMNGQCMCEQGQLVQFVPFAHQEYCLDKVEFGEACYLSRQCPSYAWNGYCKHGPKKENMTFELKRLVEERPGTCACRNGSVFDDEVRRCKPSIKVGNICLMDIECKTNDANSACVFKWPFRKCTCKEGFEPEDGSCVIPAPETPAEVTTGSANISTGLLCPEGSNVDPYRGECSPFSNIHPKLMAYFSWVILIPILVLLCLVIMMSYQKKLLFHNSINSFGQRASNSFQRLSSLVRDQSRRFRHLDSDANRSDQENFLRSYPDTPITLPIMRDNEEAKSDPPPSYSSVVRMDSRKANVTKDTRAEDTGVSAVQEDEHTRVIL